MSWYNVPDGPLSPPEDNTPTRTVEFTVTRIYTYSVELDGITDDDELNQAVHEIAISSDRGNFEEQVIEIDDVSPKFYDWLDYEEDDR